MHAVIFSGGKFSNTPLSGKAIKGADVIIAADGGAMTALKIGITPHIVIGDFDSLTKNAQKKLESKHVEFIRFQTDKDETDTELAVLHAQKLGATKITILAGTEGDRIDHVLANLLLSTVIDIPLQFVQGSQVSFVAKGPTTVDIKGKLGDILSLISLFGDTRGITTKNLYYPLKNETLFLGKPRGVSNVFTDTAVSISFQTGFLLVIHTIVD